MESAYKRNILGTIFFVFLAIFHVSVVCTVVSPREYVLTGGWVFRAVFLLSAGLCTLILAAFFIETLSKTYVMVRWRHPIRAGL